MQDKEQKIERENVNIKNELRATQLHVDRLRRRLEEREIEIDKLRSVRVNHGTNRSCIVTSKCLYYLAHMHTICFPILQLEAARRINLSVKTRFVRIPDQSTSVKLVRLQVLEAWVNQTNT